MTHPQFGFKRLITLFNAKSIISISLLTAILIAWNVRLAGWPGDFLEADGIAAVTTSAN